ncbi:NAD-dependent epimerase/dehydratase family protein [Niveispirillum sp.]|uniref:NAD-dependent epimerase/dehydratase family protein n=1 Tax=Niveispirillum sp. TaxID=1917217 RepID=UPI001B4D8E58|nr:NAD-dependent epimerase/dehydratase family protein [Niveispirillum sp.]MBP7336357.1 GDP-mannose 4,6-dehydratase [Niveispirillum sp.]
MTKLVTGAAGFIGFSTARSLLESGETVVGIDIINDYYDVGLKMARLRILEEYPNFTFYRRDIADSGLVDFIRSHHADITEIIHLAAQAGVRYSLVNPYAYVQSNLAGQVVMLELARALPGLRNFVYASSSSVYGANKQSPFSVDHPVTRPISLYAATKRADELITYTYSHLFGFPAVGLRFFTVYGPWGRPDMATFLFTDAILAGRPIQVFNNGEMWRDFTYIDDIVAGIRAASLRPPGPDDDGVRHTVYNLGNHRPEKLTDMIGILEQALGRKAIIEFRPMQPGDVVSSCADIETSRRDLGFEPTTDLAQGLPQFVSWFRDYYTSGMKS